MQQIYHSNASTNLNIRTTIQKSNETNSDLANRFNISKQTVSKWRNRDFSTDKTSKPNRINYSLSEMEQHLIASIRKSTWLPLDEIFEMMLEKNENISRSAVYRTFVRENINTVPKQEKEKAKKFKEYQPGFIHIDVTYLPKFNTKSYYLFVAIDRCTRAMFYKVYETKTADNASDFIDKCIDFFPFEISHILTDNGLEFTNRLHVSKKGNKCTKPSKVDVKCNEKDIEHRLTPPFSPKTNGMVERANGTIKNETILKNKYSNQIEMIEDLANFLIAYNLYRRHGSLRKELNVKTPFKAIEKWYEIKPEIFKETPNEFKIKLINLQNKLINSNQQPCET